MQDPLFIFNGNFESEYLYNASKAFPILLSDIIIYLIQMEGKSYKKISQYRISDQLLGEGSYSKVYLAWDSFLNPVAAKVIPLSSLSIQEISNLQSQISLLRKCKHQNIVSLLQAKKSRNHFYIFMQYCEEGTLDQLIKRNAGLSEKQTMILFTQIAKGIQAIRKCNVVHRDLKPANILLKQGIVKISDFGFATRSNGKLMESYKGSPLSMAPQILRREPYTEKVDVYSAGTVLYQMLYGISFFQATKKRQILKNIEKSIKNQDKKIQLSKEVQQLLNKMLDVNPQSRIDMNGVIDILSEYRNKQIQIRLNHYRMLSMRYLTGIGVMGQMIAAMGLIPQIRQSSPTNMDLKLYGKLCSRMTAIASSS